MQAGFIKEIKLLFMGKFLRAGAVIRYLIFYFNRDIYEINADITEAFFVLLVDHFTFKFRNNLFFGKTDLQQ